MRKRRLVPSLALVLILAGSACASAAGQLPPAPEPEPARPAEAVAPAEPVATPPPTRSRGDRFAELTRDAMLHQGLFDFYVTDDKLFMAVPVSRLGQDFLMEHKIARGVGAGGLFGGTMLNLFEADIVALERRGDRLFLIQRPHRFRAEEGTPQALAVDLSYSPSVVEAARIEAIRGDTLLLVNVYDWFVGDLSNVSQRVRRAAAAGPQPANVSFDRSRSYLESVKAFPKNVNILSTITFRPQQPVPMTAVPDSRFISLSIHSTLAELPAEPMEPRLGDDRLGFFMTVHKDFTVDDSTHFVRYVNRWRLEPGEPAGGGLAYPREPLVFYLDHTIPVEYRPYFEEGILAWNTAFEAAGFKDAIRAELLPDGADAEDIRYPTLRWNTSDQPGYSAIGPSTVDPRTGEILDADQLYEANMILGFRRSWENLVSPQESLELALGIGGEDGESVFESHRHFAGVLSAQGSFLRTALAARGEIGPEEPVPAEYLGEAIRWVVMHEVGHTLGLRHNFRSSADTPLDRLHDREWARTRGLVSSVMDYHAPNVAPAGQPQGYYYSPTVGSADSWKIAFGYTPDPELSAKLAREASAPGHSFGTDEDARGPSALDPLVNVYDLSDDPLRWAQERTVLIAGLWRELPQHVLTDNTRYAELTSAFRSLLGQYGQALAPAVKYVGGQYVHRTRVGDRYDVGPFVLVPKTRQLAALDFLTEHAFSEEAFAIPPEVLRRMGPNRWNHWGTSSTFSGRIDYPLHEEVLSIQETLLEQLTHSMRLARIRDAELRFGGRNVLTVPELVDALTRTVWSEVWQSPGRDIASVRRDLQRAHLDRMVEILVRPDERMPADARAVVRMNLVELERRLSQRVVVSARFDDYTRAHLAESRSRIRKALEAGLEVELRR